MGQIIGVCVLCVTLIVVVVTAIGLGIEFSGR